MTPQEIDELLEKAADDLHDARMCIGRGEWRGALIHAEAAQYLAGDAVAACAEHVAQPTPTSP